MRPRWRVERAGDPRGGYGLGWFATCGHDVYDSVGRWFPTWAAAIRFVDSETAARIAERSA